MQESEWARILEPALHAMIATRCHRAYRHDLRNGLQGIYGGFDALNRLLQMPVRDVAKVERTSEFVRQAITGHEKSLERVLHGLAPLNQPAEPIDAGTLLQELVKFLINDAAAQRVTLRTTHIDPAMVQVRVPKLRLALLTLLIDGIDAMSNGGTLQASATSAEHTVLLELCDQRPGESGMDPWVLDLGAVPAYRGWSLYLVRLLISAEGGTIACQSAEGGGRTVSITLPRLQD
jgi:signal transduction histidine kinase